MKLTKILKAVFLLQNALPTHIFFWYRIHYLTHRERKREKKDLHKLRDPSSNTNKSKRTRFISFVSISRHFAYCLFTLQFVVCCCCCLCENFILFLFVVILSLRHREEKLFINYCMVHGYHFSTFFLPSFFLICTLY